LFPILAICSILYAFIERPFMVLSHDVAGRFRRAALR